GQPVCRRAAEPVSGASRLEGRARGRRGEAADRLKATDPGCSSGARRRHLRARRRRTAEVNAEKMSPIARESPAYWEASGSAINVGMRLAPVVYCLVALAGCMSSAPIGPTTPVDLQIKVAAGRTTEVPEAAIRLHFQGVMGD